MTKMYSPSATSPHWTTPKKALLPLTIAASLVLAACSEPEIVLPGKRENLRSVLQEQDTSADAAVVENQSRAISLPGQTRNTAWAQSAGSPQYRTNHPALGTSLTNIWSSSIGAGDSRKFRITADPVVSGGLIYTLDASSVVTATNTSGATVWSQDIRPARDSEGDGTGGGVTVHDGTLYVSLGFGELVAMNAKSGAVKWSQQLDATGSGRPTAAGNLVYLTSGDDTGWAIEADTGRIAWQIGASEAVSNILGAPAPVVTDDLTIFAFGSGEVQAVFRRGGLRRWGASVLGERPGRALSKVDDVTGTPMIFDGVLYAGNQAGRIVALDATSGRSIWAARDGAVGPVWAAGDSVFAITDTNELVRLEKSDGARVWAVRLPNFVKDKPKRRSEVFANHGPVLAGGRIIIASGDGQLRSYDPRDGSLVGSVEIPSGATTAPVVAGNTLYVVGRNGQLHAFR
ncbi:PQQ-binding-like beta-propeller repeat protein [Ascidiaceihabitans sp.]|uniref:outer membrane protein assembly factor BamB family protein n=1 Tax=Ascidiaceihabitans sp. TaxID=1872644 RepID=UPI003299D934